MELVPKKSTENGGFIRYKGIFLARTPSWCFFNVVIATMTLQKIIFILTSNKNNINERHAKRNLQFDERVERERTHLAQFFFKLLFQLGIVVRTRNTVNLIGKRSSGP